MNAIPKKHKRFILILFYIILLGLFLYYIVPGLLGAIMPFLIAYLIARAINPLVDLMEDRLRLPRKLSSAICVLLSISLLGAIVFLAFSRITHELSKLTVHLPAIRTTIEEALRSYLNSENSIWLPAGLKQALTHLSTNIGSNLFELIQPSRATAFDLASKILSAFPTTLVFLIVLSISTFFMSSEKNKIGGVLKKYVDDELLSKLMVVKDSLMFAFGGFVKAQLTLITITFAELYIWFLALHMEYALTLALLVAAVDAMPILGTGTILIPWAVFNFITGNYNLGLLLLIVYGTALAVRQLLEPKLISHNIGMHPLIILPAIYIGLKTFGLIGIIILPCTAVIIKNLFVAGIFDGFFDDKKEDY